MKDIRIVPGILETSVTKRRVGLAQQKTATPEHVTLADRVKVTRPHVHVKEQPIERMLLIHHLLVIGHRKLPIVDDEVAH